MAGKVLEIPFGFGNLISVTPAGAHFMLWFSDTAGQIRGIPLDPAKPELILEREIVIKRRTDAQTRRKRGTLPPITAGAPAAAPAKK